MTSMFATTGDAYDRYMGRYSTPLAPAFADAAGVAAGQRALDVGCGSGALTGELVRRLGADHVWATDPSPPFVEATARRWPGVDVRPGRAEAVPFPDHAVDVALAQLVLHFVAEPGRAAAELRRVVRPGGRVAACVWEFGGGMELLRAFWDAALQVAPDAPDEARALRFGREGEIAALFAGAGLVDVRECTLDVESAYSGFDELWGTFLLGIGPAGAWCAAQPPDVRDRVRDALFARLGAPTGGFTLRARARGAVGTAP